MHSDKGSSDATQSKIELGIRDVTISRVPSLNKFDNLVTSNYIQVHIKNDYLRDTISRTLEGMETNGRTTPSRKHSPYAKNYFDSNVYMSKHEDFHLFLNNVSSGDENHFSLDDINNLINRENEGDYDLAYRKSSKRNLEENRGNFLG